MQTCHLRVAVKNMYAQQFYILLFVQCMLYIISTPSEVKIHVRET